MAAQETTITRLARAHSLAEREPITLAPTVGRGLGKRRFAKTALNRVLLEGRPLGTAPIGWSPTEAAASFPSTNAVPP